MANGIAADHLDSRGTGKSILVFGFNQTEVNGLPKFLDLLRSRSDPRTRSRGLLTDLQPLIRYGRPDDMGSSSSVVHSFLSAHEPSLDPE